MSTTNENRNSLKLSKASTYLSGEENDLVFRLLGRRCQSQCTTVAQLYQTESPNHFRWLKCQTGALCFVKDNSKRSYFARMFCLMKHELVWEQEMYDTIEITKVKPYLLVFEGEDGIVGLNFAFEDETEIFMNIAITTVMNRNRRRQERKTRMRKEPPARPPPIVMPPAFEDSVKLRNPMDFEKLANNQNQQSQIAFNNSKNKKCVVKKLTKADIGTPSNFKHVTHVGWNAKSGFDLSGEDEALRPFLQKAGVSENQLKDRRTRNFIYDFIQTNNVEEIVRKEKKPAAPPIPVRNQNNGEKSTQRLAPPPPPPVQRDYNAQSNNNNNNREALDKDPPPVPNSFNANIVNRTTANKTRSNLNTVPPVPPPPPPPTQMLPPIVVAEKIATPSPVNDGRNALMESIRKGKQLKKVDATASNSCDSRSDLLSEIRSGIELRPITERTNAQGNRTSDGGAGTDALADALRRALEQRKMAVNGPSSSESENSDDGEWSE